MAKTLNVNRRVEKINIKDSDGEIVYEWSVRTDDKSLEAMLKGIGNAMERTAAVQSKLESAETPEEMQEQRQILIKLMRRSISSIIGERGWKDILEWIGDGEEIDPTDYVMDIGEVFAALITWLYDKCTTKQLRAAGAYFKGEETKGRLKMVKGKKRK